MNIAAAAAAIPGRISRPALSPEKAKFIAFYAMVIGMFMAVLDIQIVAASLTQIQSNLGASPEEVSWIQTSYLIAEVMTIPVSGFFARALSTRVLYTVSTLGFVFASVGCGLAWSLPSMIVMRIVQGIIGGAMIPTAMSVVFTAFKREQVASLGAIVGLTVTLAPTIGPSLGGYLTEHFSWRMLFFINLVPGLIVAAAVWLYADFDKPEKGLLAKFNLAAFGFMATALGLLEYILEEGADEGWFQSRKITLLTVIAVLAAIAFLRRTLPSKTPIVELRAFADRNFTIGSIVMLANGALLFGFMFLLPLYFARVQGLNALQTGWMLLPGGISMFAAAPFAGRAARVFDPRLVSAVGIAIVGFGALRATALTADWGYWDFFWPQFARGFGMMLAMSPISMIALGHFDQTFVRTASPLFNLTRNLGGAMGLAILNTTLNHNTTEHARRMMDRFSLDSPAYAERAAILSAHLSTQGAAEPSLAAAKILAGMARQQAEVIAFADCFWLVVVSSVVSIALLPFTKHYHATAQPLEAH